MVEVLETNKSSLEDDGRTSAMCESRKGKMDLIHS